MTVAIIDYGSGNLHSARKAFERAVMNSDSREEILLANDPDVIRKCDRIVLPGVGAFQDCLAGLTCIPGLLDALVEAVTRRGKPFFGICVGMQLMATRGLEHSTTPGLDWISGEVRPITPNDPNFKVPHMGWNTLLPTGEHPLLKDISLGENGLHAYFVHSYHLQPARPEVVLALSDYGGPIVAVVGRDNMVGTQFHPEKSQKLGLAIISNFLRWRP